MNNRLLQRKQFIIDVIHQGRPNVSKAELKEKIGKMYKVKDKQAVFLFGSRPSSVAARAPASVSSTTTSPLPRSSSPSTASSGTVLPPGRPPRGSRGRKGRTEPRRCAVPRRPSSP